LLPDKDGVVRVDRKLLGDRPTRAGLRRGFAECSLEGGAAAGYRGEAERLAAHAEPDPAKPFAEKKEITVLTTGQTLTLPDLLTSDLETYDTFGSVFALYLTLSGNDTLSKFTWLLEWPRLKDEEKRAKYSEFACHELNFLLSRKDPDFFAKVVQPYLRNKKDKTFLDDYLIGSDLRRYLEPWRFAQLNAVERALLTARLQGEGAGIARHLRELWELLPPQPDVLDRLFETALRGRAMDESRSVSGGFAGAKAELAALGDIPVLSKALATAAKPGSAPAAPATAAGVLGGARGGAVARGQLRLAEDETRKLAGLETNLAIDAAAERAPLNRGDKDALGRRGFGTEANHYYEFADAEGLREKAKAVAYYRRLGPTKEWAENNYYHLPIEQQNAQLIPVNAFWRDFAAWMASGAKAPFLSSNFTEANRNFSEIMFALAVLDLPFEAAKHTTRPKARPLP
jgi:hypothetical protein